MNSLSFILLAYAALIGLVVHVTIPKVAARTLDLTEEEEAWVKFTKKFKTSYASPIEAEQRKAIFKANLRMINRHNDEADEGHHSFKMKLNKFADLTQTEFKAKYLMSNPDGFAGLKTGGHFGLGLGNQTIITDTLPLSYDMRDSVPQLLNPIQDQKACGSCWAFATTALLEYQYAKRYGKVVKMSEQYLVDCDVLDEGCQYGYPKFTLFYSSINGLPTAASRPYKAIQSANPNCDAMDPIENSDYFYYNSLYNVTEAKLKSIIVNYGMPIVSVDGDMLQFYDSGVFDGSVCSTENHVVNAVGYHVHKGSNSTNSTNGLGLRLGTGFGDHSSNMTDTDSTTASSDSYWILKNQWGSNWGENGYFRVKMNGNPCLARNFVWYAQYN